MIVQCFSVAWHFVQSNCSTNCSRAFRRSQRIENHSSFVLRLLKILDPRWCQTLNKDEKLDSRSYIVCTYQEYSRWVVSSHQQKLSHLTHVKLCLELRISHIRVWRIIGFELWILACLLCLLALLSKLMMGLLS